MRFVMQSPIHQETNASNNTTSRSHPTQKIPTSLISTKTTTMTSACQTLLWPRSTSIMNATWMVTTLITARLRKENRCIKRGVIINATKKVTSKLLKKVGETNKSSSQSRSAPSSETIRREIGIYPGITCPQTPQSMGLQVATPTILRASRLALSTTSSAMVNNHKHPWKILTTKKRNNFQIECFRWVRTKLTIVPKRKRPSKSARRRTKTARLLLSSLRLCLWSTTPTPNRTRQIWPKVKFLREL